MQDRIGSLDLAKLKTRIRAIFADFVQKRSRYFPEFKSRAARDPGSALLLLRPLSVFPIGRFGAGNRKYVFLTARHEELIRTFNGSEAVIIGKGRELGIGRELGMPFCFLGDLYAAAHGILFGRRLIPQDLILRRWASFLSRQQNPCYLVVANDTTPMSLVLTEVAKQLDNVRVVCVQHGLFNAGFDEDDIEGRNSDINLVYDTDQLMEMKRRLPTAVVEVMGFPTEVHDTIEASGYDPQVVLVGTGTMDTPNMYAGTLSVFRKAAALLRDAGIASIYRPHPMEPTSPELLSLGVPVDREEKKKLLSGPRRTFVGFTSTLLYEANLYGHAVVLLDDECLAGYSLGNLGPRISATELDRLPEVVKSSVCKTDFKPSSVPLRTRFEAAISRAESNRSQAVLSRDDQSMR